MHTATQFIDSSVEGDLDWNTVDSRAVGYIVGYEKFCDEAPFVAQHVELRGAVRLPQGPVAFTADRIADWHYGRVGLREWSRRPGLWLERD